MEEGMTRLTQSQVRNEIAVLKKVSMGHQNILTLVDYFETMNNRQYFQGAWTLQSTYLLIGCSVPGH